MLFVFFLELFLYIILQCYCSDVYACYSQHVIEHGKPNERSAIISKLAGQIVKMSQQKFASNVVEKCLTFGGPEERQILVNEMLGSTDENEPLQVHFTLDFMQMFIIITKINHFFSYLYYIKIMQKSIHVTLFLKLNYLVFIF